MAKETPYPLRLESEQSENVKRSMRDSGLSQADVIRKSLAYGLQAIDWPKLKHPPLRPGFADWSNPLPFQCRQTA